MYVRLHTLAVAVSENQAMYAFLVGGVSGRYCVYGVER